jgi:uncharacterized protein YqjF (DUF2071 family)
MLTHGATPRVPTDTGRLAARTPPDGKPVMFQQWRDLLFLHWAYPAASIQETLPKGLIVDQFEGKAWLGLVPFFMQNVRPRFVPALPVLSNFMEMNLRTYVYDRAGVPGVWFYSLDANQPAAVAIARRFFHLPYQRARMKSARAPAGMITYESHRAGNHAKCRFEYGRGAELPAPAPGSLDFFLIERYRLYAKAGDHLCRGAVSHKPYPLCGAHMAQWHEELTAANGLPPAGRAPDHVVTSPGVDVAVFPLKRI